ncbi:unnamed protein product, partial [Prunus brigantina]
CTTICTGGCFGFRFEPIVTTTTMRRVRRRQRSRNLNESKDTLISASEVKRYLYNVLSLSFPLASS